MKWQVKHEKISEPLGGHPRRTIPLVTKGPSSRYKGLHFHTAPKSALWDHSERLITLESSARSCHPNESTGRPVRYKRCEISLRGNVESSRCSIERNGSSASESLAQNFDGLSNFRGGGHEPHKRREAGSERVEGPEIIAATPCGVPIKRSVRMPRQRCPRGCTPMCHRSCTRCQDFRRPKEWSKSFRRCRFPHRR